MSNLNDIFFTPAANQELTYDQVLEDVQRYFAENHASTIAEAGEGNAERATSLLKELMEHYIVKRKYPVRCGGCAGSFDWECVHGAHSWYRFFPYTDLVSAQHRCQL